MDLIDIEEEKIEKIYNNCRNTVNYICRRNLYTNECIKLFKDCEKLRKIINLKDDTIFKNGKYSRRDSTN